MQTFSDCFYAAMNGTSFNIPRMPCIQKKVPKIFDKYLFLKFWWTLIYLKHRMHVTLLEYFNFVVLCPLQDFFKSVYIECKLFYNINGWVIDRVLSIIFCVKKMKSCMIYKNNYDSLAYITKSWHVCGNSTRPNHHGRCWISRFVVVPLDLLVPSCV